MGLILILSFLPLNMDPAVRDAAVKVGSAAIAGLVVYKLISGTNAPVDPYRPVIDPVVAAAAAKERWLPLRPSPTLHPTLVDMTAIVLPPQKHDCRAWTLKWA